MKALVLTAPQQLEIRDEPEPHIDEGEVLVSIRACTIGRADLECYARGAAVSAPFGYEATGVVEAVGTAVEGVTHGDRVLLRGARAAFAEYCAVQASHLIPLPASIGFEEGAIAQRLPAVIRGIEKSVEADHTVFLSGAGPTGILCAQVARAYGAARVIASDLHAFRLRRIEHLAADVGIDASTEDVIRRVREETGRRGADVCIECAGVEASFRNCEAGLRNGGVLVVAGRYAAPVSLDLRRWASRSFNLATACAQPHETPGLFHTAFGLIDRGAIALRPLLTHVFPLHRAAEAFGLLLNDPGRAMKIALVP